MKNPVTILLLTVHLFAYTDIIQVFKFPNLFLHYQTHRVKNKSIGVVEFLLMHYGNSSDKDSNENKDDRRLPFKTIQPHIFANAIVAAALTILPVQPLHFSSTPFFIHYSAIIPSSVEASLLRPPIFTV